MTSAASRLSPQTCFRLPHCFGRIRGLQLPCPPALRDADQRIVPLLRSSTTAGFPTPVGCRRHPLSGELAAIEATAPLIVLPLWMLLLMMLVVMASSESSRSADAVVIVLLLVVLLYIWIRDNARTRVSMLLFYLLGIMRLFLFPAFGEILRQWYANVSAGPSLSGTHYGQNRPCGARVTMRSAAVEKPPQGRHFHLAGSIMLLYVGEAAAEEQGNNGRRYARQSRQKPPQTRILFAPNPEGR